MPNKRSKLSSEICKPSATSDPLSRRCGLSERSQSCLFVILSGGYDPNSNNWAFGTVGTILGFWLKALR